MMCSLLNCSLLNHENGHTSYKILLLRQVVCFVCHGEISQTMRPLVTCLVPLESPRQGGVHGLCFVAFGPTVGKLLNFKVFLRIKKYKKITFTYILPMATTHEHTSPF